MPLQLLKALFEEPEGIPRAILQKIGANVVQMESMIDGELQRLPKTAD